MEAGEAVEAVLRAASLPQCSHILITDDNPQRTLHQKLGALGGSWGLTVFEVAMDPRDSNSTKTHLSRIVRHARRLRLLARCLTVVVASDDPAFFAAFAESSDTGRLVVWTTRLLAVTGGSVMASDVKQLLRQHWTLSMMNAMFLVLSATPGGVRCGVYTHLPYSPVGAQVVRLASWTPARGLVLNARHKLFPDKYDNFHGSPLNMTVFPFSPYWMDVERSDSTGGATTMTRTGRDYTILETVAAALNFTINILPYGVWDEVMFRLEQRVALLSPIKLAIMPHLLEIYDFTFLIEPATLGFSMAKPTLKPRWQSLYYPLKDEVWASILAALLLVPIVLLLVSYAGEQWVPTDRRLGAWPVAEVVLGSMLAQTIPTRLPGSTSTRLLVATWLVFAFIVGKAYRGNLTAFLTVPKYPARPETLKQLIATGAL
ncbi:ionotropic receptor 21a-like [Panulirus ornatus]|uniref:ionotropic receptor 21a-like n=1 Tax=Panulirus ornatus TaxID=150431 RepID=UPI003A8907C1